MEKTTHPAINEGTPWPFVLGPLNERVYQHLRKWFHVYLGLLFIQLVFASYFSLAFNVSNSLPGTLFIVQKGNLEVHRGDLVAFQWEGADFYNKGSLFLKRIVGEQGDSVTEKQREFFVNGLSMGVAKEFSKTGKPLSVGKTGVIPEGEFYVAGDHKDSLDSRYAVTGWIHKRQIAGKAWRVF